MSKGPGRWHQLYFVLAALDMATLVVMLYLNAELTSRFKDSVRVNQEWSERSGRYSLLAQQAGSVNQPGNDVFDSREPDTEHKRLDAAMVAWLAMYAEAWDDVARSASAAESLRVRKALGPVRIAMDEMVQEALQIFAFFRTNRADLAGERMATMDRKYDAVNRGIASLNREVQEIQRGHFDSQIAQAALLANYERAVGGLLVVIIISVALYGRKIARHVAESNAVLETSQIRLARAQEIARLGDWEWEAATGRMTWSPELYRLLGVDVASTAPSLESLIGAIHPDERDQAGRAIGEALRRLEGCSRDFRILRADGAVRTVSMLAQRAAGGTDRPARMAGVVLDITERKQVEQMKNEFVSTVSHELRTPLTSIRGSLGLISAGVVGQIPPKAKGMLDIAVKNCDRLVTLVNDILDVEKIASGKMDFKMRAIRLDALVKQAVETNRPYADSHGVLLALEGADVPATIYADSDRMIQVLANLVSNACKFSPRGETVTVRLARPGGRVRVEVRDRGPGIPEEFRSRIFQKFAQAESGDASNRKGTGLGLAISKSLIERMGGTIGFTTETGKGSTFYFEMDERKVEPVPPGEASGRPRILICEDEGDIARVLRGMVGREGFDADVALTLEEARLFLSQRSYAAMTLDLVLPDGHAVPFMRELRAKPATAALPIIVISAHLDDTQKDLAGLAFEILDWVEKPVPPDRLTRALERIPKAPAAGRRRILHVEDDPDVRSIVSNLVRETADVDYADSVRSAWEKLKLQDYDLLILDIGLPDGSGLELLSALRKSTSMPIPSLIFSAHELSATTAGTVSSALLKSKTSNEELARRIRMLLHGDPARVLPLVP